MTKIVFTKKNNLISSNKRGELEVEKFTLSDKEIEKIIFLVDDKDQLESLKTLLNNSQSFELEYDDSEIKIVEQSKTLAASSSVASAEQIKRVRIFPDKKELNVIYSNDDKVKIAVQDNQRGFVATSSLRARDDDTLSAGATTQEEEGKMSDAFSHIAKDNNQKPDNLGEILSQAEEGSEEEQIKAVEVTIKFAGEIDENEKARAEAVKDKLEIKNPEKLCKAVQEGIKKEMAYNNITEDELSKENKKE